MTTLNYEFGWGLKFHFCPFPEPREPMDAALTRYEHHLALRLGLKPGMRGLDAGCGTGGPSREVARFAGVHITGVSINPFHVQRSREYARLEGLAGLLDYVEGDFMVGFFSFPGSSGGRLGQVVHGPCRCSRHAVRRSWTCVGKEADGTSISPSRTTRSTLSWPSRRRATRPRSRAATRSWLACSSRGRPLPYTSGS